MWDRFFLQSDAHPRVVKRGTEDLDNIFEGL